MKYWVLRLSKGEKDIATGQLAGQIILTRKKVRADIRHNILANLLVNYVCN